MDRFKRTLRHLATAAAAGRRAFPPDVLQAIQGAIAKGEVLHRAEVRMIIEASLGMADVLRGMTAHERAMELFVDYRVWDTEENNGVLVYVNLADHKVEIIADRSAARAIHGVQWQAVCRIMTEGFARGGYRDAALTAMNQVNALLAGAFPASGAGPNELSDRPLIL